MATDPQDIRDLAAWCDRGAVAIGDAQRDVVTLADHTRWRGPAADRFRRDLAADAVTIAGICDRLAHLRLDLLRQAARLDEQQTRLRRIEAAVRAWAAAHPPTTPTPNASLIASYPPHLDPAWDTLATHLRAAGATW